MALSKTQKKKVVQEAAYIVRTPRKWTVGYWMDRRRFLRGAKKVTTVKNGLNFNDLMSGDRFISQRMCKDEIESFMLENVLPNEPACPVCAEGAVALATCRVLFQEGKLRDPGVAEVVAAVQDARGLIDELDDTRAYRDQGGMLNHNDTFAKSGEEVAALMEQAAKEAGILE